MTLRKGPKNPYLPSLLWVQQLEKCIAQNMYMESCEPLLKTQYILYTLASHNERLLIHEGPKL